MTVHYLNRHNNTLNEDTEVGAPEFARMVDEKLSQLKHQPEMYDCLVDHLFDELEFKLAIRQALIYKQGSHFVDLVEKLSHDIARREVDRGW